MQKFINDELKYMTVLNERVGMASPLSSDKVPELVHLVNAILGFKA